MGFLRSGHGGSAHHAAVIEVPPIDEAGTASANATSTAEGLAVHAKRGKPFTSGNTAAVGRPPTLARLGVDLDAASPAYRNAMRKASRYVMTRRREYSVSGGGHVSAGVCALLAASGRALAGSVLLQEQAGQLLASSNPKLQMRAALLLVQSSRLGAEARQCEASAIAVHEREVKSRVDNRVDDLDWMKGPSKSQSSMSAEPSRGSSTGPDGSVDVVTDATSVSRSAPELSQGFSLPPSDDDSGVDSAAVDNGEEVEA